VKLLFDENLSPKLVGLLSDLYPDSTHVRNVGLARADDELVWAYAKDHGLAIVSKDADFHQRSFVYGAPPKVVWIRRGNCSTADIERVLRQHQAYVLAFENDVDGTFLELV
jgi:predicted nuclease of predicted toxin-antitoxin system